MAVSKQQLPEFEAAKSFVLALLDDVKAAWPQFSAELQTLYGEKFRIQEDDASYDFSLALLSLELQALPNLFPAEQANRVRTCVLEVLRDSENLDNPGEQIAAYDRAFKEAVASGENPIDSVSVILIYKWLNERIWHFETEFRGKKTGYLDPLLIMITSACLINLAGRWKKLRDKFELVT